MRRTVNLWVFIACMVVMVLFFCFININIAGSIGDIKENHLEATRELADLTNKQDELEAEEISPCLSTNMGAWQGKTLYSSQDGVVKDSVQTQIVANVRYIGTTKYVPNVDLNAGEVVGAYDTTGLGVFEGGRNFSSLTIPDHILAIGNNAFKDCQMKSVSINFRTFSAIALSCSWANTCFLCRMGEDEGDTFNLWTMTEGSIPSMSS